VVRLRTAGGHGGPVAAEGHDGQNGTRVASQTRHRLGQASAGRRAAGKPRLVVAAAGMARNASWRVLTRSRQRLEGWPLHADDPVLDLMDRFTAALNSHDRDAVAALVTDDIVFESTSPPPDGTRYEGRDAVRRIWAEMLTATPQARFSVEEQFSDGSGRAVVRWRYDWADGHVRGVDIVRVRNGQLAESLAYVKG
jgi:ketosteroid isomerase-like protein